MHVAGSHLLDEESGEFNVPIVRRLFGERSMLVVNFARWEQGSASPSIDNLIEVVQACGFDLPLVLVPRDRSQDERLGKNMLLSPERRVQRLLSNLDRA